MGRLKNNTPRAHELQHLYTNSPQLVLKPARIKKTPLAQTELFISITTSKKRLITDLVFSVSVFSTILLFQFVLRYILDYYQ